MKTNGYSNSRFYVSGLAAAAITTVIVSALVESFDPVQLLRFDDGSATATYATAEARRAGGQADEA